MGFTEIGNIVGLSRTAVKTRVSALENKGIIKGYKAIVDPQEAPEMMTSSLMLKQSRIPLKLVNEFFRKQQKPLQPFK